MASTHNTSNECEDSRIWHGETIYKIHMSVTIHDFAFSYDELFNIIHACYDHIIFNNIISENILIVTGEFNQSILF